MTLRGTSTAVWAKGIWREEGQGSRSAWSRWETFPEKGPGKVGRPGLYSAGSVSSGLSHAQVPPHLAGECDLPLVDGPVLVVTTEELLADPPKGSLPLSGCPKAATKNQPLAQLLWTQGKELCGPGRNARKREGGIRAAVPVCAGAATVAWSPGSTLREHRRPGPALRCLWVMEEAAFFFFF